MQQEHREILEQTEYGRELLGRVDEQERFRRRMQNASEELRRLGGELRDQRLLAIADGYAREVTYLPGIYLYDEAGAWEKSQEDLKRDRERIEPKVRRKLARLERSKCKPVEWHERRRVVRTRAAEAFPRIETPEEAKQLAGKEIPFAELGHNAERLKCLKVFNTKKGKKSAEEGEKRARGALANYYLLYHLPREHLSLRFAQESRFQGEIREWKEDLWTLFSGVREMVATAEGLGAPHDVKACLGAWLARVRNVAYFHDPFYPPQGKVTHELDVEGKGDRLVRCNRNAFSHPRHRNGRSNLEKHLLKGLSPTDVAILETAWLLPVAGDEWDTMEPLSVVEASKQTASNRPKFPLRPALDNKASTKDKVGAVREFYENAVADLKRLNRKLRRKARAQRFGEDLS